MVVRTELIDIDSAILEIDEIITVVTDQSQLNKVSFTTSIETTNQKLRFLQDFDDRGSVALKRLHGVPSEMLSMQRQQPCQKISFKSLPSLSAKDSLENILKIRRYSEFPRRHLLKSFVKPNSLDRRPRRRLCQNKAEESMNKSNETNHSKVRPCPEVNVKKLRYQLAKDKKVYHRLSFRKFGQKIRNQIRGKTLNNQFDNAMCQELSYEEVASLCEDEPINLRASSTNANAIRPSHYLKVTPVVPNHKLQSVLRRTVDESYSNIEMLRSLENLTLNPLKHEAPVKLESLETSQQTPDDETPVKCHEPNEMKCKIIHSPRSGETNDNSFIDLQSCASRLDFSSGDDTRNLSFELTLDEETHICRMTRAEEKLHQSYESRRKSVQWNSEVEVIYYAGDTDGGKVVRRKMEPLHEEADQQSRRNGFIKLALNKNMISAFTTHKFLDPWVTVFHK